MHMFISTCSTAAYIAPAILDAVDPSSSMKRETWVYNFCPQICLLLERSITAFKCNAAIWKHCASHFSACSELVAFNATQEKNQVLSIWLQINTRYWHEELWSAAWEQLHQSQHSNFKKTTYAQWLWTMGLNSFCLPLRYGIRFFISQSADPIRRIFVSRRHWILHQFKLCTLTEAREESGPYPTFKLQLRLTDRGEKSSFPTLPLLWIFSTS